jgi:protein-S-isoprenylcysteine O-methyltransferase Ste14
MNVYWSFERSKIMSWLPVFKIGVWNAWICMLLLLMPSTLLPILMAKEKMEKRSEGDPAWGEMTKTAKTAFIITHMVIMPLTFIYSIFLPFKQGTVWLFVGLPICLLAVIMSVLFTISFMTSPADEPITTGIFAISRNPGYFSFFLMCVGIGIACASWVFLLFGLVWIVAWNFGVPYEEQNLIKQYGDAYRDYMERTPRWIGLPRTK